MKTVWKLRIEDNDDEGDQGDDCRDNIDESVKKEGGDYLGDEEDMRDD